MASPLPARNPLRPALAPAALQALLALLAVTAAQANTGLDKAGLGPRQRAMGSTSMPSGVGGGGVMSMGMGRQQKKQQQTKEGVWGEAWSAFVGPLLSRRHTEEHRAGNHSSLSSAATRSRVLAEQKGVYRVVTVQRRGEGSVEGTAVFELKRLSQLRGIKFQSKEYHAARLAATRARLAPTRFSFASASILSTNGASDYGYYVRISIGTPAVTYSLLFDTGSGPLWVQCECGRSCIQKNGVLQGITALKQYYPAKSYTSLSYCAIRNTCAVVPHKRSCPGGRQCLFSITYGSGGISGRYLAEFAYIPGSRPRSTLRKRVTMACVSTIDPNIRAGLGLDGIMGMQFGPGSGSLLYQFYQSKLLAGVAAYCMDGSNPAGSKVRLGAGKTPKGMKTTPLFITQQYSAFINVLSISIRGKVVSGTQHLGGISCFQSGCYIQKGVLVDTGTSLTTLSPAVYNSLIQSLGGFRVFTYTSQGFDCTTARLSALPPISVNFGSSSWLISPKTYMIRLGQGYCLAAFSQQFDLNAIIGESWIENTFIQMDFVNGVFGFAPQNCARSTLF